MTKEEKLANDLLNATDDHWFNPAILGHLLSNQPYHNTDRIMELVAHILKFSSKRYKADFEQGTSSEGLFLANELNAKLNAISKQYKWKNLKLPQETKKIISGLPESSISGSKNSWLLDNERQPFADSNVMQGGIF